MKSTCCRIAPSVYVLRRKVSMPKSSTIFRAIIIFAQRALAQHPSFKDPNVVKHISHLHDKYVLVPADKVPNNVCKSHDIECLIEELGIENWQPYIHTRRHFRTRKSWTIIDIIGAIKQTAAFYYSLLFMIYLHGLTYITWNNSRFKFERQQFWNK